MKLNSNQLQSYLFHNTQPKVQSTVKLILKCLLLKRESDYNMQLVAKTFLTLQHNYIALFVHCFPQQISLALTCLFELSLERLNEIAGEWNKLSQQNPNPQPANSSLDLLLISLRASILELNQLSIRLSSGIRKYLLNSYSTRLISLNQIAKPNKSEQNSTNLSNSYSKRKRNGNNTNVNTKHNNSSNSANYAPTGIIYSWFSSLILHLTTEYLHDEIHFLLKLFQQPNTSKKQKDNATKHEETDKQNNLFSSNGVQFFISFIREARYNTNSTTNAENPSSQVNQLLTLLDSEVQQFSALLSAPLLNSTQFSPYSVTFLYNSVVNILKVHCYLAGSCGLPFPKQHLLHLITLVLFDSTHISDSTHSLLSQILDFSLCFAFLCPSFVTTLGNSACLAFFNQIHNQFTQNRQFVPEFWYKILFYSHDPRTLTHSKLPFLLSPIKELLNSNTLRIESSNFIAILELLSQVFLNCNSFLQHIFSVDSILSNRTSDNLIVNCLLAGFKKFPTQCIEFSIGFWFQSVFKKENITKSIDKEKLLTLIECIIQLDIEYCKGNHDKRDIRIIKQSELDEFFHSTQLDTRFLSMFYYLEYNHQLFLYESTHENTFLRPYKLSGYWLIDTDFTDINLDLQPFQSIFNLQFRNRFKELSSFYCKKCNVLNEYLGTFNGKFPLFAVENAEKFIQNLLPVIENPLSTSLALVDANQIFNELIYIPPDHLITAESVKLYVNPALLVGVMSLVRNLNTTDNNNSSQNRLFQLIEVLWWSMAVKERIYFQYKTVLLLQNHEKIQLSIENTPQQQRMELIKTFDWSEFEKETPFQTLLLDPILIIRNIIHSIPTLHSNERLSAIVLQITHSFLAETVRYHMMIDWSQNVYLRSQAIQAVQKRTGDDEQNSDSILFNPLPASHSLSANLRVFELFSLQDSRKFLSSHCNPKILNYLYSCYNRVLVEIMNSQNESKRFNLETLRIFFDSLFQFYPESILTLVTKGDLFLQQWFVNESVLFEPDSLDEFFSLIKEFISSLQQGNNTSSGLCLSIGYFLFFVIEKIKRNTTNTLVETGNWILVGSNSQNKQIRLSFLEFINELGDKNPLELDNLPSMDNFKEGKTIEIPSHLTINSDWPREFITYKVNVDGNSASYTRKGFELISSIPYDKYQPLPIHFHRCYLYWSNKKNKFHCSSSPQIEQLFNSLIELEMKTTQNDTPASQNELKRKYFLCLFPLFYACSIESIQSKVPMLLNNNFHELMHDLRNAYEKCEIVPIQLEQWNKHCLEWLQGIELIHLYNNGSSII